MHKLVASATVAALSLVSSAAGAEGDWSGFHVDGHLDAGWLTSHWSGFDGAEGGGEGALAAQFLNTVTFHADNHDTGWGGGVGVGYNFQTDNLVLGVIGDWTWLNASDTQTFAGPVGPDTVSTHINSVGTLRGVVGFAMDNVMPYATGGWAWGNVNRRFVSADGLSANLDASSGWTAGGGLNIALGPQTAINLEVLYVNFGSASKTVSTLTTEAKVNVSTHMTIARVGVDFRF